MQRLLCGFAGSALALLFAATLYGTTAANAQDTLEQSTTGWLSWSRSHKGEGSGEWSDAVLRSLITLKAELAGRMSAQAREGHSGGSVAYSKKQVSTTSGSCAPKSWSSAN